MRPGDSGGPILRAFAPNGDLSGGMPDLDVLIGITSFGEKGKKCGESLIPGVYTAVGQYGDWIKRQMEEVRKDLSLQALCHRIQGILWIACIHARCFLRG